MELHGRIRVAAALALSVAGLAALPVSAAADHPSSGAAASYSDGAGLGSFDLGSGLIGLAPPLALGDGGTVGSAGSGAGLAAADDSGGDFHSPNFRRLG